MISLAPTSSDCSRPSCELKFDLCSWIKLRAGRGIHRQVLCEWGVLQWHWDTHVLQRTWIEACSSLDFSEAVAETAAVFSATFAKSVIVLAASSAVLEARSAKDLIGCAAHLSSQTSLLLF